MAVLIRPAVESDLAGILAITNHYIANSTAIYFDDPLTLENRRDWYFGRMALGYPVLVASDGATVLGFSSFGDFRPWPGYRHTVEHSVMVAEGLTGQGVGARLVESLLPIAAALGKHIMIAGVDAENGGSLRFHEKLGFERVAHFREVGHKFGRWLDLVFLQRRLEQLGDPGT